MATIKLHGSEVNTNGNLPSLESEAPDFTLVNKDLEDVSLSTLEAGYKLISIVPSLDTPVCALSTQKFNEIVEQYEQVKFIVVSADLPFAMSRFCTKNEFENVITLSMMRSNNFAKDYGVLIEDGPLAGLTARALVVLNEDNKVVYTQLVEEISNEPDYEAATAVLAT